MQEFEERKKASLENFSVAEKVNENDITFFVSNGAENFKGYSNFQLNANFLF